MEDDTIQQINSTVFSVSTLTAQHQACVLEVHSASGIDNMKQTMEELFSSTIREPGGPVLKSLCSPKPPGQYLNSNTCADNSVS
jgi:hypothetical protein